MSNLILPFLFSLMLLDGACQHQCCRYLAAPSTIYVQMNPSAWGIVSPHTTTHPSTTMHDQIFANHLQWVIMTDKPWTRGSNVYYAVSAQGTPQSASFIDLNQPTLYFMPNWWNKIQQAAGIADTSPFAIQLNNAQMTTAEPSQQQFPYYSYPPPPSPPQPSTDQMNEHVNEYHDPQPAATITVLNEQPDLLPQSAQEAQELLQEIQKQLQRLNQKDQTIEPTNRTVSTPVTPSTSTETTVKTTVRTILRPTTTKPKKDKIGSIAEIVSADNDTAGIITTPKPDKIPAGSKKGSDEAPAKAKAPQRFITKVNEDPQRFTSIITREHKLANEMEYRGESSSTTTRLTTLFLLLAQLLLTL